MGKFFASAECKRVSAALKTKFPAYSVGVEDAVDSDTRMKFLFIVVYGMPPARRIPEGEADAIARAVFIAASQLSSQLVKVIVMDEDLRQHEYTPFDAAEEIAAVSISAESPATKTAEPREIVSARVEFWTDESASVGFWDAFDDDATDSYLAALRALVPYYFAKLMYNLGDSDEARHLNEWAAWAGQTIVDSGNRQIRDTNAGTETARSLANVLPDGLSLIERPNDDSAPRVTYETSLLMTERDGEMGLGVTLECTEGAEGYYAPASLMLLMQMLLDSARVFPVAIYMGIAGALLLMSQQYDQGPAAWDNLAALDRVPREAIVAALNWVNTADA